MTKIDVKQFGKVAVLMGGHSKEREVSLWSGEHVLKVLKQIGINAHKIDVDGDVVEKLMAGKFDCACVMLHGRGGEDGTILGKLETLHIPYTGSDVASSALAMDKVETKRIWQTLKLPTLPFVILNDQTNFNRVIKKLSLPICVKPAHEGSSYGVIKVTQPDQLKKAYQADAREYQDTIIAEPWIIGREFTIAVLNDRVLPVIEIIPTEGFYDFKAKYISDKTVFHCPCDLPEDQIVILQRLALKAFKALGCGGWGRVDFLQDKAEKFYLTEVNTIPGMTEHSLVPIAAKAAGMTMEELVLQILQTCFKS